MYLWKNIIYDGVYKMRMRERQRSMEEKHERVRIELIRFEEIDMITASAATQMTGLVLP